MKRFVAICFVFVLASSSVLAQESAKSEFRQIFNGKDLTGWKGNPGLWTVEDGAITGTTTADAPVKTNTFLVWDEGKVGDFVLELEYRALAGDETKPFANSGIQYRSQLLNDKDFVVGGYQADIDFDLTYSGINYEERGRGILAQRGQRVAIDAKGNKTTESIGDAGELGKKIKQSQWNTYRVEAKGNKLSHYINDTLMSETIDDEEGAAASEGVLAFQIHVGPPMKVQFRNVRLKAE